MLSDGKACASLGAKWDLIWDMDDPMRACRVSSSARVGSEGVETPDLTLFLRLKSMK